MYFYFNKGKRREPVQRLPLKFLFSLAVCECNLMGTQPEVCDFFGRCLCRSGVTGLQCDSCQPGLHSFPACQGKAAIACRASNRALKRQTAVLSRTAAKAMFTAANGQVPLVLYREILIYFNSPILGLFFPHGQTV